MKGAEVLLVVVNLHISDSHKHFRSPQLENRRNLFFGTADPSQNLIVFIVLQQSSYHQHSVDRA